MAASTTSFADRLTRLDSSSIKLFAGDEAPQEYRPGTPISFAPKAKKAKWGAVVIGALLGTFAGYLFKINIGIELFFSQPILNVYEIVKADPMTASICVAMIAGPIFALVSQLVGRKKSRLTQFLWAYVAGEIGVNLTTWYAFYLTLAA